MAGERPTDFGTADRQVEVMCDNMKLLQHARPFIKGVSSSPTIPISTHLQLPSRKHVSSASPGPSKTHAYATIGEHGRSLHRSTSKKLAWRQFCVIEALRITVRDANDGATKSKSNEVWLLLAL